MLLRLVVLFTVVLAAPAQAVVNGERIAPSDAPWFVPAGLCGATLIAPDRLATAAHCVDPVHLEDFETIRVGRETRHATAIALPGAWRERSAGFARDDLAIIRLDRPVTSVKPVPLATAPPKKLRILGQGKHAWDAPTGRTQLRVATLSTLSDAACAPKWKGTTYARRFEARSELCAGGRASVCAGDSGGPMVGGTLDAPVLVGIISWTGKRCGEDGLPSVGAEVAHYAAFLTAPEPVWGPVPGGPTQITRDGDTLICSAPSWTIAPDTIRYRWRLRTRGKTAYEFETVATGPAYTPERSGLRSLDLPMIRGGLGVVGPVHGRQAGHPQGDPFESRSGGQGPPIQRRGAAGIGGSRLSCEALGENHGGRAEAPPSSIRV